MNLTTIDPQQHFKKESKQSFMKRTNFKRISSGAGRFSLVLISILFSLASLAQVRSHIRSANLLIKGTSTLHDWEMKSSAGNAEAVLSLNKEVLTGFSALTFSMPAETLKSGHGGMDKNCYKALKTSASPSITFVLSSSSVTPVDGTTYRVRAIGNLTIAGVTKQTELIATCKWNAAEKSFDCTGSKKMKMSEFKVDPPTFMFGTIKTGDEIEIAFNLKINA
jgi:hypothetical protein